MRNPYKLSIRFHTLFRDRLLPATALLAWMFSACAAQTVSTPGLAPTDTRQAAAAPQTQAVPTQPDETLVPSKADAPTTTYLPITITPITSYQGPDDRVTIEMPAGGRYVIMSDSLSHGSTFLGQNTYQDMCDNRWPYTEQLQAETGVASTASLDRGNSMKTPFYSQKLSNGQMAYYCTPPASDPKSSTSVPGSNTQEWIDDLRYNPVFVEALKNKANRVAFLLIGADIFAERIGKGPISIDQYEANLGELIQYMASYGKVIYIATFPHIRHGSFVPDRELAEVNAHIDNVNRRLKEIVAKNGYRKADGTWVDFGLQTLEQDGWRLTVRTAQAGPALDVLSDTLPDKFYAKDGLHYHAEGYNEIGKAWAQALKAPIPVAGGERIAP